MLFPPPTVTGRPPSRVVVTGAGVITALGLGWRQNADGFRTGRAAFRPVTLFDVSRQRAQVAAEVDLPDRLPKNQLSARVLPRLDRASKLLLCAAHEAWQNSGWDANEPIPIVLGTTSGGMRSGESYYRAATETPARHRNQAVRATNYQIAQQGIDLANALGIQGTVTSIANACASGANAIGHAFSLVRSGQARRVLTGGYDALSQLVFAGFDSLQALSMAHCRPFDAHRDGLALGEGAAVLALEREDEARRRHAVILGEILGYGATTDVHHLTQPHPEGSAALASMEAACLQARVTSDQIDYVNAHGTGTPHNDRAEAAAINAWAGPHAGSLHVSSTKAGIGHLLGAAGAVEAVVCLMALREQWLPPSVATETVDPICRFPIVRTPADAALSFALTNSFGFGGANATLILKRWS